jgi:hypothetical protein
MSLPKYQCHKVVEAAKIKAIPPDVKGMLVLELPNGDELPVIVSESFSKRNDPQVGGYFVLYEDNYQSYSPAAAFENGYSLIKGS